MMYHYNFCLPRGFSSQHKEYLMKTFSKIVTEVRCGDVKKFDKFCTKIYPFCLEIYEIGKDLSFDDRPETPYGVAIHLVGALTASNILPTYKNYLPKSESLFEMVKSVINDKRFVDGRYSFIAILPKTKRSEGIDFKQLLDTEAAGSQAICALLKLKDGRFVEEARKYQERFPNDWFKKKVALYIERYSKKPD
jgi:hypothetical protein